jgi:hypothetical protein
MKKCLCLHCGYTWQPRIETEPKACPRCKSPRWAEEPRKAGRPKGEKYECDTCGKLITDAQSNFYEYGRHCTKCYQSLTAK